MIFKSMIMENIRSYQKNRIDFPMGTSLFEGDVGSGKSTILMAMEFALFGLGNQKGDALLRKGSRKGSVILNFSVNGKEYQVKRSLVRNVNKNTIRQEKGILGEDGKVVQLSPSEIKERILNILNFKEPLNPRAQSVIFRYAVYTPQEEMKFILSQKPDLRLQTLRKAFGIEDYKIAAENATSISRTIKDKISYLSGRISDLDEKKSNLSDLKNKLKKNEDELSNFQMNAEKVQKKLEEEKKKLDELKDLETKLKGIKAEIPHLEKQLDDKKQLITSYYKEIQRAEDENKLKYIPEIKKLEKMEKPISETEENLKNKIYHVKELSKNRDGLKANLSLLNESKEDIENKLNENKDKTPDEIEREIEIYTKKIEKQSELIDSHQKQLQKILERIYKIDAQKEDINKKLRNLDGLGELCPICGSLLDDEHKKNLKTEREREIRKLNAEYKVLKEVKNKGEKELESYNKEYKTLEKTLNELELISNKITEYNSLQEKIDKINGEIRKIDEDLGQVMEESQYFAEVNQYLQYLENMLEKLKEYNRAQDELKSLRYYLEKNIQQINENNNKISTIKQEMIDLKKALSEAKNRVAEMAGIEDEIEKLKSVHENTDREFQTYNHKIISTKTLIKSYQEDIVNLGDEILKMETIKKQLNNLKDYHIWLNDYLIPTLGIIEKHVMHNIHQEFDANFKKWFNLLMDDPSKTGKIDEEFTPIVEQDGFEQEINYLSGGEKTSTALAYRLALNSLVQKVSTGMHSNLLILDEPTDGFSKEQLFKVREILNELDCPQIIMVSHERELESFADNIFQIEKIDGVSEVTKIS